jgi:hypothetical protein
MAAWQTHGVAAAYAPDGSKFYRRGSTQTSIPPPYYLKYASLGVSCAQQVGGGGGGMGGRAPGVGGQNSVLPPVASRASAATASGEGELVLLT